MSRFGRFHASAGGQASAGVRGTTPMADINVTPLVDVMLVLVVIFILAAPLMTGSVHVELPRAAATAPETTAPQQVQLSVDANGRLAIGEEIVDNSQLSQRLARRAQANAQTELLLRADRRVPHGRIVEIMDIAQRAGLSRIGFVTQAPPAPP